MLGESIVVPLYYAAKSQRTFHVYTPPANPPSYFEVAFTGQFDDPSWYHLVRYTEIPLGNAMYRGAYGSAADYRSLDTEEEIGMIWHALQYAVGDKSKFYSKARVRNAFGSAPPGSIPNLAATKHSRIYTWKPGQFFIYDWMLKNSRPPEETTVKCTCVLAK